MGSTTFNPILINENGVIEKVDKVQFTLYDGLGGDDNQSDLLLDSENGNFQTLDERFLTKKNSTEGAEEESAEIDLSGKTYHNMNSLVIGNSSAVSSPVSENMILYAKASTQDFITFKNQTPSDVLILAKDGSDNITLTSQIGGITINPQTNFIVSGSNFSVDSSGNVDANSFNAYEDLGIEDDIDNLISIMETCSAKRSSISYNVCEAWNDLYFTTNKPFFGYVTQETNYNSGAHSCPFTITLNSSCLWRNTYNSISSPYRTLSNETKYYDIDLYMFSVGNHKITNCIKGALDSNITICNGISCFHFVNGYGSNNYSDYYNLDYYCKSVKCVSGCVSGEYFDF